MTVFVSKVPSFLEVYLLLNGGEDKTRHSPPPASRLSVKCTETKVETNDVSNREEKRDVTENQLCGIMDQLAIRKDKMKKPPCQKSTCYSANCIFGGY